MTNTILKKIIIIMSELVHEPFSSQMLNQQIMILNESLAGVYPAPWGLWVLPTAGACRQGGGCQSRMPFPPAPDNRPAHFGTACNAESSKNPALRTAAALKTLSCHPTKQRLGLCQPRSAGQAPVCVWTHFLHRGTFGPSSVC